LKAVWGGIQCITSESLPSGPACCHPLGGSLYTVLQVGMCEAV
jgi:hypothetical protein